MSTTSLLMPCFVARQLVCMHRQGQNKVNNIFCIDKFSFGHDGMTET